MSHSRETIEQLLSGYMDEALNDAEREQFEELLRNDSAVANELNELRSIQDSLRLMSRHDRNVRLEPGFADRVIDASVQRARGEGLAEDHPVMRLSEQPSTSSSARTKDAFKPSIRWVSVVAALAASVAIAFVLWNPKESSDTNTLSIANVEPAQDLTPEVINSEQSAIAAAHSNRPATGESVVNHSQPVRMAESSSDKSDSSAERMISPIVTEENLVASTPSSSKAVDRKAAGKEKENASTPATNQIAIAPQRTVGAVMVLEISRTEAGRRSSAVRRAMNTAEIRIQNEKLIAKDIVGILEDPDNAIEESSETSSILYLEGTAKQLDQFILSLCSDARGIDTIRFGLASELPILNLLQKLQRPIDPKTVRHSASWSVEGESPEVSRLISRKLVGRTMVPLANDVAAMGVVPGGTEDGPDVMSQIFVVVR